MGGTVVSILEKTRVFFCIFVDFCYVKREISMKSDIAGHARDWFGLLVLKILFYLLEFLEGDKKGCRNE
ncbi:hypothetical protein ASY01nite_16990 [Acetobacter syzygii]|nr:hypothetical protein Absy_024_037 [Acetobacter syzygii]GBR64701.1 hypothetical protein AA0483_1490 [Acetobacter syzygii NRIC 0483]GEL56633.1 hypothetical protein ASY01nite_16990 [Acetobacter syzygii]